MRVIIYKLYPSGRILINEFGKGGNNMDVVNGAIVSCWLCENNIDQNAIFCHSCGALQPPRETDYFRRMGFTRKFDIDLEQLDRHYMGFMRPFAPQRFKDKSSQEANFAERHLAFLATAFETLHDPIRRAQYLLDGDDIPHAFAAQKMLDLFEALEKADTPCVVDHLVAQVERQTEQALMEMASAFRTGKNVEAAKQLAILHQIDLFIVDARAKRHELEA